MKDRIKILKKIFKVTALSVVSLLIIVLTLVLVPEIWFRGSVFTYLAPKLLKKQGYEIEFSKIDASVHRQGFKTMSFFIEVHPLKLKSQQHDIELKKVLLKANIDWMQIPPRLSKIEEVTIDIPKVYLHAQSDADKKKAEKETSALPKSLPDLDPGNWVPSWLKETQIGKIDIHLPFILSESAGVPVDQENAIAVQVFTLDTKSLIQIQVDKVGLQARAQIPLNDKKQLYPGRLNANIAMGQSQENKLRASIKPGECKDKQSCFTGKVEYASYKKNSMTAAVKYSAQWDPEQGYLEIHGAVAKIYPWLSQLKTDKPCRIEAKFSAESEINTELKCGFQANLNLPPNPDVPNFKFPSVMGMRFEMGARLKDSAEGILYDGKLGLKSDPVLAPILETQLTLDSQFNGDSGGGLDGLHHQSSLSLDTRITEIQKAVVMLRPTAWAIPAPMNNLKGAISFNFKSVWKDWETETPFSLKTMLHSNEQSLQTSTTGKVQFEVKPKPKLILSAESILEKIRLSLPRMDLAKNPRMFPDSRIKMNREKPKTRKQSLEVDYDIVVKTPPQSPLLVDLNLIPEPIAIEVTAKINSKTGNDISFYVRPVPFEIFRRKGVLEGIKYTSSGQSTGYVNGKARTQAGEYQIFAEFYGKPDKIRMHLSSDPPVPEDDLWAIFLFGEPLESLDIEEQDSSQATSRALSKGAMGLLSLYLFASSPVERVDYDPATQNVSVRFRVQEGTSVEASRGAEEVAGLGLRQRLGRGWAITAKVSEEEGMNDTRTQAGAMLEWSSRY